MFVSYQAGVIGPSVYTGSKNDLRSNYSITVVLLANGCYESSWLDLFMGQSILLDAMEFPLDDLRVGLLIWPQIMLKKSTLGWYEGRIVIVLFILIVYGSFRFSFMILWIWFFLQLVKKHCFTQSNPSHRNRCSEVWYHVRVITTE